MRPRSRSAGLRVQPVGDQLVAYDELRQRLHVLNRTVAATWRHCDGRNALADIAELVGRELGIPADERLIALAVEQLHEARLLEDHAPARGTGTDGVSRREMLHWAAAAAAGVFLPVITSCGAPLAPDRGPNMPGVPKLDIGDVATTTSNTSTTTFPPTTTSNTSTTTYPPTTTSTSTTFPPTTTSTSTTFPPTTTSTSTTFPPTTTSTSTTFPPTTTSTTRAPRKVQVCHKGKSIMVDADAVADHLAHGDTLGPCP